MSPGGSPLDPSNPVAKPVKGGGLGIHRTKEQRPVPEGESGPSNQKRPRNRKPRSATSVPRTSDINMLDNQTPPANMTTNQPKQHNTSTYVSSHSRNPRQRSTDKGRSVRADEVTGEQPSVLLGALRLVSNHDREVEYRREERVNGPRGHGRGHGAGLGGDGSHGESSRGYRGRGTGYRGGGLPGGCAVGGLPTRPATHERVEQEYHPRQTPGSSGLSSRAPPRTQVERQQLPSQAAHGDTALSPDRPRSPYRPPFPSTAGHYGQISRNRNHAYDSMERYQPRPPMSSPNVWGQSTIPYVSAYEWTRNHQDPRHTVPPYLLDPAKRSPASIAIMQMWIKSAPSETEKRRVAATVQRVESALKRRWPRLNGIVDVFGSCSWGGECIDHEGEKVDLDLMYRDFANPKGYTPDLWGQGGLNNPSFPPVYNVYPIANALRDASFEDVQPIKFASTPIVKFQDPVSKIALDLNINDLGGWYNSSLMLAYCRISPYTLRPLIHFVKLWAKRRNLNDASGAKGPPTFSSYTLGLMCISYLQTQGLLPNLQDPKRVHQAGREKCYAYVGWNQPTGIRLSPGFVDELLPGDTWKPSNPHPDIRDVVCGFFKFYRGAMDSQVEEMRFPDRSKIRNVESLKGIPDTRYVAFSVFHGGLIDRGRPVGKEGTLMNEEELKRWKSERKVMTNGDEMMDKDEAEDGLEMMGGGGGGGGGRNGDTTMKITNRTLNTNQQTPNGSRNGGGGGGGGGGRGGRRRRRPDRNTPKDEPPVSPDGQPWNWTSSALIIQDPFLHEKNCNRAMINETFLRVFDEIERTINLLDEEIPPYDEILKVVEPPLTRAERKARAVAAAVAVTVSASVTSVESSNR